VAVRCTWFTSRSAQDGVRTPRGALRCSAEHPTPTTPSVRVGADSKRDACSTLGAIQVVSAFPPYRRGSPSGGIRVYLRPMSVGRSPGQQAGRLLYSPGHSGRIRVHPRSSASQDRWAFPGGKRDACATLRDRTPAIQHRTPRLFASGPRASGTLALLSVPYPRLSAFICVPSPLGVPRGQASATADCATLRPRFFRLQLRKISVQYERRGSGSPAPMTRLATAERESPRAR